MLPIIDLNSSDYNCIYSTFLSRKQQAPKLNIITPCITFDQPLWLKAIEEVEQMSLEIVVRLGSFHTLMSYLGSTGSGIEQVLQLMCGKDVVPHIISGKAISRALRGHFMVEAGLNYILLTQL